jgi:hypothetical protein
MTLVELLIVVALIAMLMALALPAINAARESGRRTQCANNIRQLALGAVAHEVTHGFFPGGGWAGGWVGIPGRGTGPGQPGGWAYVLLPFLERNDLSSLGVESPPPRQRREVASLLRTTLTVMYCPTRRQVRAYPIFYSYARVPFGSSPVSDVARSDYAINAGGQRRCEVSWFGPTSLAQGDDPAFAWPDLSDHTGISYSRSKITTGHLLDGAGRTYLIGEKYLAAGHYTSGEDHGDDWSMYTGYQDDMHRVSWNPPRRDDDPSEPCRFGSAHASTWHVSFCDASVRALSYTIDAAIHRSLGHRADRMAFGDDLIR